MNDEAGSSYYEWLKRSNDDDDRSYGEWWMTEAEVHPMNDEWRKQKRIRSYCEWQMTKA